ncbi:OmpA family protein [Aquirhabdus sp.]|uniref:OmpA family protein n=1 Tax=Aquirhabdus sp. TaxID=2824160 RepID=UPI00396C9FD5
MKRYMSFLKIGSCIALVLSITACQNLNGLSRKQVAVLKSQGFVLQQEGWTLGLPEKLLFNSNESDIKPETAQTIIGVGQQLTKVDVTHLLVNGYTDNTGAANYNQELSLKRAQAVAEPLIKGGIPVKDIQVVGRGEANPIADNATPEGRSENRRVAIIVKPQ